MRRMLMPLKRMLLMKKFLIFLLFIFFSLNIVSCNKTVIKDLSCADIIKAYENTGYYVSHGEHKDKENSSSLCYIKACISETPESDYIYFTTCFTERQPEEVAKSDKYNLAIWFYAAVSGETRWLTSKTYGRIACSYYNPETIKPFNDLIK
jgi:hypothetical protein